MWRVSPFDNLKPDETLRDLLEVPVAGEQHGFRHGSRRRDSGIILADGGIQLLKGRLEPGIMLSDRATRLYDAQFA